MKLKELLKKQNIKWPEGATHAVQDYDGCVKFASSNNLDLINGVWNRKSHALMGSIVGLQVSSDWNTAIVGRHWFEGHPHAELMLQYAQDAMTTSEPWKLWQVQDGDFGGPKGEWWNLEEYSNLWIIGKNYRRKPITKLIHGVEIPDISFTPEYLQNYWFPAPSTDADGFCHQTRYAPMCSGDIHRLNHNLCYPHTEEGKQAAILHAKAMLGIK